MIIVAKKYGLLKINTNFISVMKYVEYNMQKRILKLQYVITVVKNSRKINMHMIERKLIFVVKNATMSIEPLKKKHIKKLPII